MKVSIQMITLGLHELSFLFDHQNQPVVEVKGVQYNSLQKLNQAYPQLNLPENLDKWAQAANFLAKGLEFQFIQDIESFKRSYVKQIEAEGSSLLDEGPSIRDYGPFDLSAMHAPILSNQHLVFFVRHDYLGIPYRVTLNFSNKQKNDFKMHYELLSPLTSF